MGKRMDDLNWRLRSCRVMLLLLIPVFYFSALLFMGKKAKQDNYIKLGLFFGAVSLFSFIVGVMGIVFQPLFYALVLQLGCWTMCIIQTLRIRQQYLQYLEWAQEDLAESREPMVFRKKWRLHNSLWCFWDCIPLLGGLATYFMGRRMSNKLLKWAGLGSVALVFALLVYFSVSVEISKLMTAVIIIVAYASICIHPLLAGFYFEEYLDATAEIWKADFEEYPLMDKASWRVKNSLWQIITCIPYVSSLGLFFVGIHRESGKVLLGASLLCIAEMVCVAGPAMLMENEALKAWPLLEGVAYTVGMLWFFVYALIIFYGAAIRWDMLRARAEALCQEVA